MNCTVSGAVPDAILAIKPAWIWFSGVVDIHYLGIGQSFIVNANIINCTVEISIPSGNTAPTDIKVGCTIVERETGQLLELQTTIEI